MQRQARRPFDLPPRVERHCNRRAVGLRVWPVLPKLRSTVHQRARFAALDGAAFPEAAAAHPADRSRSGPVRRIMRGQ